MNKTEFIRILSSKTSLSLENSELVNKILEDNFFISKKNKDKIVSEIVVNLGISENEAINIYETAKSIFNEEIRKKLKHPFKNRESKSHS